MTSVALLRQSFEDLTMHENTADCTMPTERSGARTLAPNGSHSPRSVGTPSRRAAQRQDIESKLHSLFKALDKTPRRADHAVAAGADRTTQSETHIDTLMGETAISPTWRLNKAIGEIADRQAFLERQAVAEGMSPAVPQSTAGAARFGAPRAAAADLRRRFEPPHASAEADDDRAPDAPAPSSPERVPSIFSSLQGDIARLARRLDAVGGDVARRPMASARKQPSVEDIRALLDEMRPDASIETLSRHVESLAAKLDQISEKPMSLEAIDRLSRRVDDVYAEISTRLSAQPAAPAIDMKAMERFIRDLFARADRPASDLHALERAVHDLAAKLDQAEQPRGGPDQVVSLKAEVGTLSERLDKSDAGLLAVVAMERSLGELFTQIGQMQSLAVQAAETTARTAIHDTVKDTVQAALAETKLAETRLEANDAAIGQVRQDLASFRANRDDADRQLQSILSALNSSLERVVDRLGALEGDAADDDGAPEGLAPVIAEPVASSRMPLQKALREPMELDVPIEPGSRLPTTADGPDPTTFIAAARRAAQNATAEHSLRVGEAAAPRGRLEAAVASSQWFKTGKVSKRRPLLLALASLTILAGAVQAVRMNLGGADTGMAQPAGDQGQPAPAKGEIVTDPKGADAAPASPTSVDATPPATASLPAQASANPEAPTAAVDQPANKPDALAPGSAPIVAAPAEAVAADAASPASASLPTMAMGPRANVAAVQAADLASKAAAAGGIPGGLRAQADAGVAAAQYEIGLRFADGRGVARDLAAAASWFDKAARQGLAPAAYRLGSAYEKGLGLPRDAGQSVAWYGKAAEAGNVRAMHNLAVMLAEGANGKPDYAAASTWFIKAAEAGVKDSQYNLAILYARGMGVEQSLRRAYTWFAIAAAQGDADSAKKRDDVEGRLDPDAIAEAKKAVADFKPVTPTGPANDVVAPAGGWDGVSAVRVAPAAAAPKPAAKDHLGKL